MANTSTSLYLIPVNQSVRLSESIKADGIVVFRTPQLNLTPTTSGGVPINNNSLNLLAEDQSILLHIGFRLRENVIVFNSRDSSGGWLREERVSFGSRLDGRNHTVAVYDHGDRYQILTNGSTAHYFNKQLRGDAVSLQYNVDAGQAPIFSDPIAAETYTNWAALVPGST